MVFILDDILSDASLSYSQAVDILKPFFEEATHDKIEEIESDLLHAFSQDY